MADGETPVCLVLWDPDFVIDWIQRNETYARLRERANSGTVAITVQTLAEVLRIVRLRPSTAARLQQTVAEIREQFRLLDLTPERAESYAEVVQACRKISDPDVAGEAWFVWQVALCRSEGHRVMTKAPSRYMGLVDRSQLA